jgi:hypothetical protein
MTQVIAISVSVAPSAVQGDTIHAHAHAITAGGDSVAATIRWASFDTIIVGVVDSTMGTFLAKAPGTTSIQARDGTLPSNPIPIVVVAPSTP